MTTNIEQPLPAADHLALEIARAALPYWGLERALVEPVKVRENAVFRVLRGGQSFALRVHRHGNHSDAALQSEFAWMRALEADGIAVPQIIRSRRGGDFEVIAVREAPARQVDVFAWIDGHHPRAIERGVASPVELIAAPYRRIGALMARMHIQSSRWRPPRGFERHAWNADGLVGERPHWGRFWELAALTPSQRRLMETLRERLATGLRVFPTDDHHYGLIHGDLVPDNVLMEDDTLRVIDFDDAGFGWHLFDIATSLYFVSGEGYYDAARQALIEGYRSQRPLSDVALAALPMFMAARGATYLGWVHTREGAPAARIPSLVERACVIGEGWLASAAAR